MSRKLLESNRRTFNTACLFARQAPVTTVLITAKSEPIPYPVSAYLEAPLRPFRFIELQTNGIANHAHLGQITREYHSAPPSTDWTV